MNAIPSAPSRRAFLGRLAALPFASLFTSAALGTPPPESLRLDTFMVAGFRYYDGPSLLSLLVPGARLELRAEPTNPYDKLAVEVFWGGRKLGYVPRDRNLYLSPMLRAGLPLTCQIVAVRPRAVPWEAVEAAITLELAAGAGVRRS